MQEYVKRIARHGQEDGEPGKGREERLIDQLISIVFSSRFLSLAGREVKLVDGATMRRKWRPRDDGQCEAIGQNKGPAPVMGVERARLE
jgi:hypothetical protein